MENATFSLNQSTNFQFLPTCQYIISFGIFFNNLDLLPLEYRNHSVSVLNTLFDYLHNAKYESITKLELLQEVLAGSDLYGGGKNERLDMKYVNESYHYIISRSLFFNEKNLTRYLAYMFKTADNLTYAAFKDFVHQHFSKQFRPKDFCSSRKETVNLTSLAIEKIFNENIWSIFPEPEEDMNIMDVDYIHAMIGLKIARSVQADDVNLSFKNYYHLGREIKFKKFEMEIFHDVLELFKTPVLFYYASKQKDKFMPTSDKSLSDAYKMFFIFFYNLELEYNTTNVNYLTALEFFIACIEIKGRTLIATELLKKVCEYSSDNKVPYLFVSIYKTSQWLLKYILPKRCQKIDLPNLEIIFNSQFDRLNKTTREFIKMHLEKVFQNKKLIADKINLNSTDVFAIDEFICSSCASRKELNNEPGIIFAIVMNETDFYTLKPGNREFILQSGRKNREEFSKEFSRKFSQKLVKVLKNHYENYDIFLQRLEDMMLENIVNVVMLNSRNPTMIEEKVEFLKSLVPLNTCKESIKSGKIGRILLSCSLDALSLLPIKIKDKYFNLAWNSLIASTVKQISSTIQNIQSLNKKDKSVTVSIEDGNISDKEKLLVFNRKFVLPFLKALWSHKPKTLISAYELSYDVFGSTNRRLRKMILNPSNDLRNLSEFKNFLSSVEFGSRIIINDTKLLPDNTGLIPQVIQNGTNYKIVRYFYPGGSCHFGPKCILSFGRIAEMRRTSSNATPIAVVQIKFKGQLMLYSEYNYTSGTIGDREFRLNRNGYLKLVS